jgi:MFS transporter, PCFT/HCP family, solute carrier family 46 (folate transporter), member 1
MCALAFLYTFFFVSESIQESDEMSSAQRIFDINLIKDMLHTCCKKRPAYRRLTMFLVMMVMAIFFFALNGMIGIKKYLLAHKLMHFSR